MRTTRCYILAVIYDNQKLSQYNIYVYFHVDSLLFAFVACRHTAIRIELKMANANEKNAAILPTECGVKKNSAVDAP